MENNILSQLEIIEKSNNWINSSLKGDKKKIDFVSRASKTFVKQTFQTISIL